MKILNDVIYTLTNTSYVPLHRSKLNLKRMWKRNEEIFMNRQRKFIYFTREITRNSEKWKFLFSDNRIKHCELQLKKI